MIAINLTFFVILGMFLLFLWVTQRIILKPALDVMDQRDAQVDADTQAAQKHLTEAKSLEQHYTDEMANVRRVASLELDNARREGTMARVAAVQERKAGAEREIQAVIETARKAVDKERTKFESLVPELAERIADRLELGSHS